MDRCDLKLYGKQQELIRQAALLKKPTILVLENGKPVDLSWEKDQVDGILAAWFGGEMGARAIADVLLGEISPSGKLPVSFPKSMGHLPCYYSALPGGSPIYLEGERKALFPFGFGLSYTTFVYSGLFVKEKGGCGDKIEIPGGVLGKTFMPEDNPLHISALRFEKISGEGCRMELTNGQNRDTFMVHPGKWQAGRLHLDGGARTCPGMCSGKAFTKNSM